MPQIDSQYAALVLIDILYENELINRATYEKIQATYKPQEAAREEKAA